MATFPFAHCPKESYKERPRAFGAPRSNGTRKHAGCDLIAPVGTPIFAVADGVVIEASNKEFYHRTHSVTIQHPGFIARYCEIMGLGPGIAEKKTVCGGDVVAYVGRMFTTSMLHFEVYAGILTGRLTVLANKPYKRRSDILNPTPLLDRLSRHVLESHDPIEPNASVGPTK